MEHGKKRSAPQWLFSERLFKAERVSIFMRGQSVSENVTQILHDLHELKKPNSRNLQRKMKERPMQQAETFEFLCEKNGASMFGFGSSTKRRPDNLVLGRLFDDKILDLFDFAVRPLSAAALPPPLDNKAQAPVLEATPCFVFLGKLWQSDTAFSELKNFIVDSFGVRPVRSVNPAAVRRVISVTAHNESHLTFLHALLKPSQEGVQTPPPPSSTTTAPASASANNIELQPLRLSLVLELRGQRLADTRRMRAALALDRETTAVVRERKRERKQKAQVKRQESLRAARASELRAQGIEPSPADLDRAATRKIYFKGVGKGGPQPKRGTGKR